MAQLLYDAKPGPGSMVPKVPPLSFGPKNTKVQLHRGSLSYAVYNSGASTKSKPIWGMFVDLGHAEKFISRYPGYNLKIARVKFPPGHGLAKRKVKPNAGSKGKKPKAVPVVRLSEQAPGRNPGRSDVAGSKAIIIDDEIPF